MVTGIVFEDAHREVWIFHNDWAVEWKIVEGLDQVALLGWRMFSLKAVDVEAEGGVSILSGVDGLVFTETLVQR